MANEPEQPGYMDDDYDEIVSKDNEINDAIAEQIQSIPDEPEVRQPDFARGEKAFYSLEEVIGLREDLGAANGRYNRSQEEIRDLKAVIGEIEKIASVALGLREDHAQALRDIVSRVNRIAGR